MSDDESMALEHRYARSNQPRGFPTVAQVVGIWKEKCRQGVLNEIHFKEHWRLYVPQVLSLDPSNNCLDNVFDEENVQNILFAPLEEFICDGNPKEVFEHIKRLDDPPTICGRVFKLSEPTYNCRECGTDPTCVLCVECFKKSEHRNHKYKMATSNGGGCCDCGDTEAWKNYAYCNIHVIGTLEGANKGIQLQEDMRLRIKITFNAILQYTYQLLTIDHEPQLPSDLRLREIEDDPRSFVESSDTYCTVLYNDETHTFEHVISTLSKVIKCSQKDAIEYVTNIDREGRAVVKCSSFQHCTELKSEVERITSRTSSRPLKVQVKHSHVIAHQLYAIKLLSWLQNILSYSKHFREIFAEVVLQIKSHPTPCTSILEGILLRDSTLWKSARVHWHRLFIAGMLKEYENKKSFAEVFTKNYGSIMKEFIRDDHDHSFSVAALAVQIYTVPTIAHYLISHKDVLFVLLNTFWSECGSFLKDGKLEFQRGEQHHSNMTFKRAQFIIYDLNYLLSSVPDSWTNELRKGFLQGLYMFLKLLNAMQGMDSVTRQVGQHMEYEPEWETAFNLHIKLSAVITSMIKWCSTDELVLTKSYLKTLTKIYENPCANLYDPCVVREIADHSTLCINYDVSVKPVSIHLPLSRFLAGLHVQLEKFKLNFFSPPFSCANKPTPEQIIEPVLRTQVMIAQLHAGLWRRNGYSILHQVYFYHNVKCRNEMLNKDIVLLQVGASLIESNDFLIHLLNKFKLIEWADPMFENCLKRGEDDILRQMIALVEEFFGLMITIISERYVVGIGKVSEKECVKKEIIQQLCIKPLSHSELSKALPDSDNHGTNIDTIIEEIATFQKPTAGSGKGLYKLKPEFYDQYNVFYYHYTKEELSKSEEAQRRRLKQTRSLDCCPPPPLPPLTEPFLLLVNLLQCDVMFYIMQLVLKRACDLNARSFSESQLHRVLHLIGYALHEEENRHCEYFMFTERSEKWNILKYLEELNKNARVEAYRDLIRWTISKFKQVSLSTAQNKEKKCDEQMEVEDTVVEDVNQDLVKKEKERIAKLAAERRLKIMAQMTSAQKSFIKENAKLYEEATTVDRLKTEAMLWKTTESVEFPIAVGPCQTTHTCTDPTYTCILCQEEQTIKMDAPAMVYGAFIQKSSVLKNEFNSPIQKEIPRDNYYLPTTLSPSPFTSICGHVMHSTCWEKYFLNISTKESRRTYRIRQPISFDIEKQEFLCPLCESLNNSILPVLQPLTNILSPMPIIEQHFSFDSWLKSVILATEKKHQELKAKRASKVKCVKGNTSGSSKKWDKKNDNLLDAIEDNNIDMESEDASNLHHLNQENRESFITGSSLWESIDENSVNIISRLRHNVLQNVCTPVPGNEEMEVMLLPNDKESMKSSANTPLISDTVLNMIMKYSKSVYTKGLGLATIEDENRLMLYCWKSCSYTIHVIETVLRNDNRSLLGELSSRQKKCIKALIRLSALQEICKNQRVVNNYAITLLGLVFDNIFLYDNTCILDWDPFGMLVSLVMCLPSLFSLQTPSPFPTGTVLDLHVLKLMLIATVAQILIGLDLPLEEIREDEVTDEDTECLKLYLHILQKTNYERINTALLWKRIKYVASPFLRCSCIFFRYLTGVSAPECLKEIGGDTYENMCKYLGLPIECKKLFDNELIVNVFKNWVKTWQSQQLRYTSSLKLETYLEFKGVISLPEDYSELINSVSLFTCPNSDHEDSRNPTLCLVCGTMLCSQSYCCQKEFNGGLVS